MSSLYRKSGLVFNLMLVFSHMNISVSSQISIHLLFLSYFNQIGYIKFLKLDALSCLCHHRELGQERQGGTFTFIFFFPRCLLTQVLMPQEL